MIPIAFLLCSTFLLSGVIAEAPAETTIDIAKEAVIEYVYNSLHTDRTIPNRTFVIKSILVFFNVFFVFSYFADHKIQFMSKLESKQPPLVSKFSMTYWMAKICRLHFLIGKLTKMPFFFLNNIIYHFIRILQWNRSIGQSPWYSIKHGKELLEETQGIERRCAN